MIKFEQIIQRLNENNINYEILELQKNFSIIICEYGGRIFGPFYKNGESILWVNPAFSEAKQASELFKSMEWNIGGDRIWIAPELAYNVKDRKDFFDSYVVQNELDPGNYTINRNNHNEISLISNFQLDLLERQNYKKSLCLDRKIRRIENPLKNTKRYYDLKKVMFCGFEQVVTLTDKTNDDQLSEVWNLTQMNAGGKLYISTVSFPEYTDYYESIDNEYQELNEKHVKLNITGDRRYKVGYNSAFLTGRCGYCNRTSDKTSYLFIRNFLNNPSAQYTKEPADLPGARGNSIHVYNDNGEFGGFAELECSGQPIGGKTKTDEGTEQIITWLFYGDNQNLTEVSKILLGVDISQMD